MQRLVSEHSPMVGNTSQVENNIMDVIILMLPNPLFLFVQSSNPLHAVLDDLEDHIFNLLLKLR